MAALSMIDDEHVINENNILLPETDNSFVGATAKQIDISKLPDCDKFKPSYSIDKNG